MSNHLHAESVSAARLGAIVEGARSALMETLEARQLLSVSVAIGGSAMNLVFQQQPPTFASLSGAGVLSVAGTAGNDVITVTLSNGKYVVTENFVNETFDAAAVKQINISAGAGNDLVVLNSNVTANAFIDGGPGNDSIVGGSGNNTILGGPGNDTLIGRGGNDLLIGGAGDDRLQGGGGNDTLYGGRGNDTLAGGTGNNLMFGDAGNDMFFTNAAAHDTVFGGGGNDTLRGLGHASIPDADVEVISKF